MTKKQPYRGKEKKVYEMFSDGWTYEAIAEELGGSAGGAAEAKKRYEEGVKKNAPVVQALTDPSLTQRQKDMIRNIEETNKKRDELIEMVDDIRDHYYKKFKNHPDEMKILEKSHLFRAIELTNYLLKSIDESLKININLVNQGNINIGSGDSPDAAEAHAREVYRAKQEGLMLSEKFIREIDVWEEYKAFLEREGHEFERGEGKTIDAEYQKI